MNSTPPTFDLGDLFGRAWEIYKKNAGPLVGAVVVIWAIMGLGSAVTNLMMHAGTLVMFFIAGPLLLGFFKMIRQALRGESVDFNLLFSGFGSFPDAYMAGFLISLFSAIGLLLCVVPGIVIKVCYAGTYLFIIDRKMPFWDAMEASRRMAMNNIGQWVILALALFVFNLAGLLLCGLGVLVTGPMSYLMIAMAYDLEQSAVIDVAATPVEPSDAPRA